MIDSKPVIRAFPYRANRIQAVVLFILSVGGVFVLGYFALHADRGANIKGIELTRDQFRLLMGVVAVLSVFGVGLMGWLVIDSFFHERRVAFTADSVILPKPSRSGMSREEVELPFDEIRVVQVVPFIKRTRLLQIVHDAGIISVPSNMFPTRRDFDTIAEMLSEVLADRDHG